MKHPLRLLLLAAGLAAIAPGATAPRMVVIASRTLVLEIEDGAVWTNAYYTYEFATPAMVPDLAYRSALSKVDTNEPSGIVSNRISVEVGAWLRTIGAPRAVEVAMPP